MRKQTLTAFCTTQDPVPLLITCSCDAFSLKPPDSASTGAWEIVSHWVFAAFRDGLNIHFVFVFTFCACLALYHAPEQVLVMMLPFLGPFPIRKCPTCCTSLGQHQCGGTLHHRLRGVNLFGRLSFYYRVSSNSFSTSRKRLWPSDKILAAKWNFLSVQETTGENISIILPFK